MKCSECVWYEEFKNRRKDEPKSGCDRPGWEGYVDGEAEACSLSSPKKKKKGEEKVNGWYTD